MRLKDIWNKLQYKMDTSAWFTPSAKVQDAMKEEGWTFRESFHAVASPAGMGCVVLTLIPETPEGESAYDTPENEARYMVARRAAADRVYNIAGPN